MVHIFGSHTHRPSGTTHMGVDFGSKAFSSPNAPAINKDVEIAAKKYELLERKLDILVQAVKDQRCTMKEATSKKLETMKIFEEFAKDTPLEQIFGPVKTNEKSSGANNNSKSDSNAILNKSPVSSNGIIAGDAKEKVGDDDHEDSVPGLIEDKAFDSESASSSSESESKLDTKNADNSGEDNEEDGSEVTGYAATEDDVALVKDDKVVDDENELGKIDEDDDPNEKESEVENIKDTVVRAKYKMAPLENPVSDEANKLSEDGPYYSDIENYVCKETFNILDAHFDQTMQYLENWKRINKTRIRAGLYEFEEMCEKLDHYQSKMNNMSRGKVDQERYERNQQKLLGILEAHATFSEKLLRYIEEVTERGWKDFYPLLLHALEFDLTYASAQFKYSAHLTSVLEALKEKVGKEYHLEQHGRLQDLESEPLGDVYTGGRMNSKHSYSLACLEKRNGK